MTLANQFLWQFAQMREAWHESQEINEVRRDECSLMICSGAVLCSAASITHASAASQSASFKSLYQKRREHTMLMLGPCLLALPIQH